MYTSQFLLRPKFSTAPVLDAPETELGSVSKVIIEQDAGNGSDTDHLRPVIEFLKEHGNRPTTNDKFCFDRDGLGTYGFLEPIDVQLLQAHFVFPPSIKLLDGQLHDSRHFVSIGQYTAPRIGPALAFRL